MATDIETGEALTLSDLHEIGYVVGLMLRPRADVFDGIEEDLTDAEVAALNAGYDAGVKETEAELKARDSQPAALPVCWDDIPY
jgi:hypothetical protein